MQKQELRNEIKLYDATTTKRTFIFSINYVSFLIIKYFGCAKKASIVRH